MGIGKAADALFSVSKEWNRMVPIMPWVVPLMQEWIRICGSELPRERDERAAFLLNV